MYIHGMADCAAEPASFARVWCDIHCVKDAVEQGNAALRRSLEKAVQVLTTNVDRLTKYQSLMVGDKVDLLRAELEDLIPVPVAADPKEIKSFLLSTMDNIHTLLSEHPLDAAGEDAATRAVNSFVSDVYAHFGNAAPVPTNQSRLAESALMLMDQAQTMYHIVKYTTERHGLGRLEALNKNLGLAAQAMQKLARKRNHELGVYNHTSMGAKRRQRMLLDSSVRNDGDEEEEPDSFGESHAWQVLLELDSTWWSIRAVLDEYLTDAERYASSISNVALLLHSYTSCASEYGPVHEGFSQLMKAEEAHRNGLLHAWSKALPLVGLLVSKVVDSDAFANLSLEDAKSAYAALKPRAEELCHDDATAISAISAVSGAVNQSLREGFFGQTERQLATLFKELQMLRSRAKGISKDSLEVLQESIHRAHVAIKLRCRQ